MFNVGGGELIVIMLLALVVLGPQRLPTAARQVGKALGDLRRLSTGFQNEVRSAFEDVDDPERVAARRNVLAKEERVAPPAADEDGSTTATGGRTRREPLRAAPVEGTAKTKATTKKMKNKKASPAATRRPSS